MMNSRQRIDNREMPTVVGDSRVTRVRPDSPSLKTSIPLPIAQNYKIQEGDTLHWRIDFMGDDAILTIEKKEQEGEQEQ